MSTAAPKPVVGRFVPEVLASMIARYLGDRPCAQPAWEGGPTLSELHAAFISTKPLTREPK